MNKRVLLIVPSIYEFALYDHYLKPFALMRFSAWFKNNGWDVCFINCLDYEDSLTLKTQRPPKRKPDGSGKFFRQKVKELTLPIDIPSDILSISRHFCRYGITLESFCEQLSQLISTPVDTSSPDLILISSGMTYWYKGVEEAVFLSRKYLPNSKIIVGGIYASLMPEHCLQQCHPDAVFTGHEATQFNALCTNLIPDFPPLQGAIPLIPDSGINSDWNCWKDAAVIRLNEGCFMNCSYCASSAINPNFIKGSPLDWIDFIITLNDYYGTSNFAFYDDALLGAQEEVLIPFLKGCIELNRDLKFYCPNAMHIKLLNQTTADLLFQAGFQEIRLGYESDQSRFHQKWDQKYRASQFDQTVSILKKAGFDGQSIRAYILAGLPQQRAIEVENAIETVNEAGVIAVVAEYSPVPKTDLWSLSCQVSPFPLKSEPLFQNNSFFPMRWNGFTAQDMNRLKQQAHNNR